ncbi:MAG: PHP domain-containing protein [Clostridia bacterium]|nr:PHP domain-containing protein [Clostridia bacterium]
MDSISFIPGVSSKDLKAIVKHFKAENIYQLKKLAKEKKIRRLKDFNSKTEMKILRGIKLLENPPENMPIGIALEFASLIINELQTWPGISQVLLVGSLRRGVEEVASIDLLIQAESKSLTDYIQKSPFLEPEKIEENKIKTRTLLGIPLFFHLSSRERWGTDCILRTGSDRHVQALLEITGVLPVFSEEEKIYEYLNLPWIAPEIRESGYEVRFAQENLLPELIDLKDIKGDLHIHSKWSDGASTIEEMVLKAVKMGYEYLAITDHSQSLKVAGGLGPQDLVRQWAEMDKLQKKYPQIRLLKGIEVDILSDGSLDLPEEILKESDIVIASIHSHFEMTERDMTRRIIKALENPLVRILAHPTGRVLGKRPGYKVDIKEVIETAACYGKVLEINASPDRLDLRDQHLMLAKTKGVKIAVNTDAHHAEKLEDMAYGVQMARRGWQTKKEIINSWSFEELVSFLKK